MPKQSKGLTDANLKSPKPARQGTKPPYRMYDGGGLCAEVQVGGKIYWRLRYRHGGKERIASLGTYPAVSLAAARKAATDLRSHVRAGRDPVQVRREATRERAVAVSNSFETVARDWLQHNPQHLGVPTIAKARAMLETYLFPSLGTRPVGEITASEVLACLRPIEKAGKLETAHRLRDRASAVFRWAIATDRAQSDPCRDLKGALRSKIGAHRAALVKPAAVGELLRAIDGYHGQPATRAAMQLLALTFVRPGELRKAEWSEFDIDGEEPTWVIPGARMKGIHATRETRPDHIVPLSRQAVEILRELRRLTGRCRLVFPGIRKATTPLSINTLTAALRALGFGKTQSAHGFRTIASTLLREQGHAPELVEVQLAHKIANRTEAAYNRAEFIAKRREMMQAWADYLDALRADTSGKVVGIRSAKGKGDSNG